MGSNDWSSLENVFQSNAENDSQNQQIVKKQNPTRIIWALVIIIGFIWILSSMGIFGKRRVAGVCEGCNSYTKVTEYHYDFNGTEMRIHLCDKCYYYVKSQGLDLK